ncbi:DUF1127 domain-containing protein [uncultured Jannaschia sp.]|uniref:DUF1127 domain-containing protein n=1 Tax=Jannaschia halovivens TaxID=3388667 RepID=UPI002623E135|nr:DUF1127 domain-containing protein [uncultured Jannaschia sp.]
MATFDTFRPAAAPASGLFANVLGRIVAWNDRRVTTKALSHLTDRELNDIGLDRGDIDAIARR